MQNTHKNLPPLPLGESVFSVLRKMGKIYVDKTAMLYELAKSNNQVFLARPRRFGKSLLLSTFNSLFNYGLRDFKGLEIEKLWKDTNQYSVVSLDLSLIKNFLDARDFRKELDNYLSDYMQGNNMLEEVPTSPVQGIREFKKWLARQPECSVVLLIDEYDSPLTSCLNDPKKFEEVRIILASFYSCLKGYSGAFRFVFLTGITKFGNAGIFSELNALQDISLLPAFGTIVGYTQDELKEYFAGHLEKSSEILSLSSKRLLEKLVANYNGFCFELTAKKKVFAPWSILNFFTYPGVGFINYWFESGGQPLVLMQYVRQHALIDPSKYAEKTTIYRTELSTSIPSNEIDEKVLLFQTGYLTIKGRGSDDTLYLGYPNLEVANSMARLCLIRLLGGQTLTNINADSIPRYLAEANVKEFFKRINNAFLAVDYNQYFINDEKTCQGAFVLVLHGSDLQAQVETHNAHGRSDIEFTVGGIHWVIELKFAKETSKVKDLLEQGKEQILTRHYGEQSHERELIRLVMVFAQKDRCFVDLNFIPKR